MGHYFVPGSIVTLVHTKRETRPDKRVYFMLGSFIVLLLALGKTRTGVRGTSRVNLSSDRLVDSISILLVMITMDCNCFVLGFLTTLALILGEAKLVDSISTWLYVILGKGREEGVGGTTLATTISGTGFSEFVFWFLVLPFWVFSFLFLGFSNFSFPVF